MTDDRRPWEQPGAVRRDCDPHRGTWLLLAGSAAVVCAVLLAPAGLVLALVTGRACAADLARMGGGRMDPAGEKTTELAARLAAFGVAVSLILAVPQGFCLFALLAYPVCGGISR
jgi:hypothetical protein